MRRAGVVHDVRGLGPHGHVCWRYDDQAEFRTRAGQFLADGVAAGEQVLYASLGERATLARELADLGLAEALASGAAQVAPVPVAYPNCGAVEAPTQVEHFARATEQALAGGFTGFRVAVDATALVRTPEQLEAFVRYEYRLDRYMRTRPISAMCAYNRRELGDEAVARAASAHPAISPGASMFRLFASERPEASAVLAGELDRATAELWPAALNDADVAPVEGELVFDAHDLSFIDHRSLLALAEYVDQRGLIAVLRNAPPLTDKVVRLVGARSVRVAERQI